MNPSTPEYPEFAALETRAAGAPPTGLRGPKAQEEIWAAQALFACSSE